MAVGIASAELTRGMLQLTVCPAYAPAGCACADPDAHPVFTFGGDPPPRYEDPVLGPGPKYTHAAWRQHCALEALRLVQAQQARPMATALATLVGLTL